MNDKERIHPKIPGENIAQKKASRLYVALGVINGLLLPFSVIGGFGAITTLSFESGDYIFWPIYVLLAAFLGLVVTTIQAIRHHRGKEFVQGLLIGIGILALIFGICVAIFSISQGN